MQKLKVQKYNQHKRSFTYSPLNPSTLSQLDLAVNCGVFRGKSILRISKIKTTGGIGWETIFAGAVLGSSTVINITKDNSWSCGTSVI